MNNLDLFGWNISSNSNSTNLCFNYNSSNKSYFDTNGDLYLNGNIYYNGSTSLVTTLSNYALLSNPVFFWYCKLFFNIW